MVDVLNDSLTDAFDKLRDAIWSINHVSQEHGDPRIMVTRRSSLPADILRELDRVFLERIDMKALSVAFLLAGMGVVVNGLLCFLYWASSACLTVNAWRDKGIWLFVSLALVTAGLGLVQPVLKTYWENHHERRL